MDLAEWGKVGNLNCLELVRGSAVMVFKVAGNRLDKLYLQYDAGSIIPLHDAFIFEAPLEELEVVAEFTSRVMWGALQEYFPPKAPGGSEHLQVGLLEQGL